MLDSMTKASAKIIVQFCFLQHCGLETARQPCPQPGIWQNCITARQLISNADNFLLLIEVELSWHFPGGKEMEIVEKYRIQSHILIDSLTCTHKKTMQIAVARQQDPPTAFTNCHLGEKNTPQNLTKNPTPSWLPFLSPRHNNCHQSKLFYDSVYKCSMFLHRMFYVCVYTSHMIYM